MNSTMAVLLGTLTIQPGLWGHIRTRTGDEKPGLNLFVLLVHSRFYLYFFWLNAYVVRECSLILLFLLSLFEERVVHMASFYINFCRILLEEEWAIENFETLIVFWNLYVWSRKWVRDPPGCEALIFDFFPNPITNPSFPSVLHHYQHNWKKLHL